MLQMPSARSGLRQPEADRRRLDAWKEIAQYLGRDVTTVRRWEKREGLPVHRHLHRKLGSVYAYADEIDAWWQRRSTELNAAEPMAAAPSTRRRPRITVAMALGGLAMLIAITSSPRLPTARVPRVPGRPVMRFALTAPGGTVVDSLALSPDGQQVVVAALSGGASRLWILSLDSITWQPLPGTEGAAFPFWSPDNGHVGFFADGRLKRIATATRDVRDLTAAPEGRGGSWGARGDIVFAPTAGAALLRVPASGGTPVPVTRLSQGFKEGHAWPEFLPDGRHVLYTDQSADPRRFGIYVLDLDAGTTVRLRSVYSSASYSSDGYLLYQDTALVAQPFDPDSLRLIGPPVPIADHVLHRYGLDHKVDFSVSRTGLLAARSADEERQRLAWIDRATGREVAAIGRPAFYSSPTLSPDGRKLVVAISRPDAGDHLWLFDRDGTDGAQLTLGAVIDYAPVWSADGERIVFASVRNKRGGLYERQMSGGADEPILPASRMQVPESWSVDGRYMTFQTAHARTRFDVWAWQLDGERHAFPVLATEANEGHSRISPDGRFIAYTSDESGQFEVYVRAFPSGTAQWKISANGGADPHWRSDGRELYYIAADRRMIAVAVATQPEFRSGAATTLFSTGLQDLWQDARNHYDVTPDGRRFLLVVPEVDRRAAPFTMLVNWERR